MNDESGDAAQTQPMTGIPPCARTLGWELVNLDPEAGRGEVSFEAQPEFTNPAGTVQGGFLAAMLDDVIGFTVGMSYGRGVIAASLEIKVSFLRPARPGRITGSAHIVQRTPDTAFAEGELRDGRGRLLATASSTLRILKTRQRPAHGE